jgi:hydroxymethylglutaryl-CoA lyase
MIVPISASAAHSRANVRKEPDAMIDEIARIRALRDARGSTIRIEAGIGTAFGCTIQGHVDPQEVLRLLTKALEAGADRVGLADTVGYADPAKVKTLFEAAARIAGPRLWCGHFHDTRGLALANVCAAMQAGIGRFDASLGGIGGCPHAPGASGNVATEDLAYMLASMEVPTGIDVEALLHLRGDLAGWLARESLHGTLWRAGLPKTMTMEPA